MEDRNLQGEVLYLVYNLLKDTSLNVADLTNTVNAFENELNASNLMGETVLWDGSVKTRTLDDMKKKHSQIPSDLLLKHLQKLLILTSKGQASASTSLLALENNKYDDPITRNLCRLKCINVIETIQEIQNKNSELKKLSVRILSIDENLAEMNEPDDSHTSALKFMGMTKEKKELLRRTETLRLETIALNSDLHEHKDGLRRMGRLGGESYRGVCNSLSCWLNNRQLGNVNSAFSGAANALGRVLQLTACHHRLKLLTDFKLHYITSGHYLTPAYCAVTDKSGRYALTGADDTLVKVWDLETGRLRITLRGHKGYITFIAVSPDNSLVATSCTFGDIRLWRLRDGECVCALRHLGCVNWMKFDDLTNSLASGGDDGFAYVWDLSYLLPLDGGSYPLVEILRDEASAAEFSARINRSEPPPRALMQSGDANSTPIMAPPLKTGMYPWSAESSGRLVLAHPQLTDAGDVSVNVLCLDISPVGNYIVTGREDGIANVWKYGYEGEFPGRSSPANTTGNLDALERLRGTIPEHEWEVMRSIANHLIVRLMGHVAPITDVKFNSKGDRLITGSLKEGAVRIWSFSHNFNKYDQIVLSMNEDAGASSISASAPLRRQRTSRSKNQLFNIGWSSDDLFVFTLQSGQPDGETHPTKLKMWDGISGLLLRMLVVSDRDANCLAIHPIIPSIVITGGDDGFVRIWNLNTEIPKVADFAVRCPPNIPNIPIGTPIKVLDASFTPDGRRIIVTDHIGRLLVFGLGDPEAFDGVLVDQYFSSDYNDFFTDENGMPIDVGTNLPVHLTPSSYLCRMDGSSYGLEHVDRTTVITLDEVAVRRELQDRRNWAKKQFMNIDPSFRLFRKNKSRYISVIESRTTEDRQKTSEGASRVLTLPASRPPGLGPGLGRTSQSAIPGIVNYRDYCTDDSEDDKDWISIPSSDGETMFRRRTRVSSRAGLRSSHELDERRRLRRTRRVTVIDVDDSDEDNSNASETALEYGMEEAPRQRSTTSRSRQTAKTRIEPRPERVRRPAVLRDNRSLWRTHKDFRSVPLDVRIYREWSCTEETSDLNYCPQVGDAVIYFPQGHAEHLSTFHESVQPPWSSFPARWAAVECRVTSLHFDFPTLSEYNQCISLVARIGLSISGIPIRSNNASSQGLVEFTNSSTRRTSLDKAEFSSFTVSLRKGTGIPDFLIPAHLYKRAIVIRWRPGMRFHTPFIDTVTSTVTMYAGTITDIEDSSEAYPNSPWECLKVQWDPTLEQPEGGEGTLGPWDAFLIEDNSTRDLIAKLSMPKFMATKLELEQKTRIADLMTTFMDDEVYHPFAFPIDLTVIPDYPCVVPSQMNMELIRLRNQNDYYRQMEAVEFDINMIYSNCALYNETSSDIVKLAADLTGKLIAGLREKVHIEEEAPILHIRTRGRRACNQGVEEECAEESRAEEEDEGLGNSSRGHGGRKGDDELMLRLKRSRASHSEGEEADEIGKQERPMRTRRREESSEVEAGLTVRLRRSRHGVVEEPRTRSSHHSQSPLQEKQKKAIETSDRGVSLENQGERFGKGMRNRGSRTNIEEPIIAQHTAQDKVGPRKGRSFLSQSQKTRRGSQIRVNYADLEASDMGEEDEDEEVAEDGEEEEDEEEDERPRTRRTSSRRLSLENESEEHVKPTGRPPARDATKRVTEPITKTRRSTPETSGPVGRRLDPELKHALHELLQAIEMQDEENIFAEPVTEKDAPGYFDIIETPMDLSCIRNKLARRQYSSVEEMATDLRIMFSNCMLYNDDSSHLFHEAKRGTDFLEAYLQASS